MQKQLKSKASAAAPKSGDVKKITLKKRKFSEITAASNSDNVSTNSSESTTSKGSSSKRLQKELAPMISAAWKVRDNAYCPYSGFKVGACLRSKKTGKLYSGCNVENAAYPTGICAERGALCAALAAEGPGITFDEIVVVTDADEVAQPCGVCRQMMVEFGTEANVNSINRKEHTRRTLGELLPFSFGPASFKPKVAKK